MKLYENLQKNRPYIIAEMSANHGGHLENAIRIIEQSAEAGADCVKIQTYTADTLTINCDKEPYRIHGGLWDGMTFYELYGKAYTPWEWQEELKNKCEEVGVDFLSTPFDFSSVDFLEKIGIEFYKIASPELVDIPLIEYVASKNKPIVMSVGMGSEEEICEAINVCRKKGNERLVLLKCLSQYPADIANMNLSTIQDMAKKFNVPIGLSDHSFGSMAPVIAVSLGARVIEKHVMLDNGPITEDSGFSMTMTEFAKMVKDVHETIKAIGTPSYELNDAEDNSRYGRRSLVAVNAICKGDRFTPQNVRSIRPSIGLKPKYYEQLLLKNAKHDYEFGDPIKDDEVM